MNRSLKNAQPNAVVRSYIGPPQFRCPKCKGGALRADVSVKGYLLEGGPETGQVTLRCLKCGFREDMLWNWKGVA